jgi:hypothetical protein
MSVMPPGATTALLARAFLEYGARRAQEGSAHPKTRA